MAVLQSVHQVKNVEAYDMVKEIPVHKYGFLFLLWVPGKDIGGSISVAPGAGIRLTKEGTIQLQGRVEVEGSLWLQGQEVRG